MSGSTEWRQRSIRLLLGFYKRVISPAIHVMPGACQYQPTCSEYAAIAVAEHGVIRGVLMAAGRILRCHPLHRGGYDPVPARRGLVTGSSRAGTINFED